MTLGPFPPTDAPDREGPGPPLDPNGQSSDSVASESKGAHQTVPTAQARTDGVDIKQLFDQAALFLAPTSLITGLMYWIGWAKTQAYWYYFGVDQTLLKFSTTDYLVRAVNTA